MRYASSFRLASVRPALPVAVALLVAAACSKKPAQTAADVPASSASARAAVAPTNVGPPPSQSPTASAIHIDDAILKACGITAPQAFFAFDSANVRPEDSEPLEKVAACFATGALKGRTLRVVGHADPRGETEYNFVLGQSRADAVGGFLVSKSLPKAQLGTSSRGEMEATGTDEAGWARDRRVDLLLAP